MRRKRRVATAWRQRVGAPLEQRVERAAAVGKEERVRVMVRAEEDTR